MRLSSRSLLAIAPTLPVGLTACSTVFPNASDIVSRNQTVRTLTVLYNNSHLLIQNGRGILIDAAGPHQAKQVDEMMQASGFDPANLETVIVTHGHHDHAGGAPHFRRKYGVPVIAGAGNRFLFAAGRNNHLCPTGQFAELRVETDQVGTYEGYEADILVYNNLDLRRDFGINAAITSLPGHTHGSIIVSAGEDAFVGDLIRGTLFGRGAETHFYNCDLDDNIADIELMLTRNAPVAKRVHMGHFPSTTRAALQSHLSEQKTIRQTL